MSNENRGDESSSNGLEHATVVRPRRHQLRVDLSERNAAVLDLARECDDFDVQMVRLPIGDYLIESGVVVERKTYGDFARSLVDGRFFPQAAALARSPHRPVVLLEGPKPTRMPDVHPHARLRRVGGVRFRHCQAAPMWDPAVLRGKINVSKDNGNIPGHLDRSGHPVRQAVHHWNSDRCRYARRSHRRRGNGGDGC